MTRAERRPTRSANAAAAATPTALQRRAKQAATNANSTQRSKLLDTAAGFFAEQGFAAAATAELAARCGVSKALLFHYYSSKEAILFDLLEGYTRHLLRIAREVQASSRGKARLHGLIRAFLAAYATSRARHIVLLSDVKHLAPRERATILDHERELVAIFAQALRAAYPRQVGATAAKPLAMTLFGMINWTFTWLRPNGRIGYDDFAETVIAMLEGGLPHAARALK